MGTCKTAYYLSCLLFGLINFLPLHSQTESVDNRRSVIINNQVDSFSLSIFNVIPHTIEVHPLNDSPLIDSTDYEIKLRQFMWQPKSPVRTAPDSLQYRVIFRVLPYDLSKWTSRFDSSLYQDGSMRVLEPITLTNSNRSESLISEQGIQYEGTFSRGLSLGNRQDLVLNSNFDLRMAGELGDGIEVLAALSDNSIPLQPEGNTQQLQEFDKIFI